MTYIKNLFKNIEKPLYIIPLILAFVSIVMVVSTSINNGSIIIKPVLTQSFAYFLGFISIFIILQINYSVMENLTKYLYIFSILFLLTPYLPIIGVEAFGARSWVNLGFMMLQPSEIVKITFIFIMASYFKKTYNKLNTLKDFVKSVLFAAPIILIVLIEDFGSATVFASIFISMCLFAGLNLKVFRNVFITIILAFPFLFDLLKPYQQKRLTAFLYPNDLSIDATYQVWQSKTAIGSGGLFGKGLFNGTQNLLDFLPVKSSDFIFSVICEELGLIGGSVIIILFIWFIYTLLKVSFSIKDEFGSLILIGFLGMFAFQIVENIGMTMGLMPVTGITLPFLSYGGSSVLSNMIALGIILSICLSNRGVAFLKS